LRSSQTMATQKNPSTYNPPPLTFSLRVSNKSFSEVDSLRFIYPAMSFSKYPAKINIASAAGRLLASDL
jgi:hypothetical protein